MQDSRISWTNHTFNPWIGCARVSQGCKHCYAEDFVSNRLRRPDVWGPESERWVTGQANWNKPCTWDRRARRQGVRQRVFCASLADVFELHSALEAPRAALWELIGQTRALDWQLLTKRPQNIRGLLPSEWGDGWPHVWLGTSIEDMKVADRAEVLAAVPARVRFISYEPALGPLDDLPLAGIDWVIYGGESGPNRRPEDKAWARRMRDRCADRGIAFWHKQSSDRHPGQGVELEGQLIHEWPASALPVGQVDPARIEPKGVALVQAHL